MQYLHSLAKVLNPLFLNWLTSTVCPERKSSLPMDSLNIVSTQSMHAKTIIITIHSLYLVNLIDPCQIHRKHQSGKDNRPIILTHSWNLWHLKARTTLLQHRIVSHISLRTCMRTWPHWSLGKTQVLVIQSFLYQLDWLPMKSI